MCCHSLWSLEANKASSLGKKHAFQYKRGAYRARDNSIFICTENFASTPDLHVARCSRLCTMPSILIASLASYVISPGTFHFYLHPPPPPPLHPLTVCVRVFVGGRGGGIECPPRNFFAGESPELNGASQATVTTVE